jgi:hypothetical protein
VVIVSFLLEDALRAEKAELHERKQAEKKKSTLYRKRPSSALGLSDHQDFRDYEKSFNMTANLRLKLVQDIKAKEEERRLSNEYQVYPL